LSGRYWIEAGYLFYTGKQKIVDTAGRVDRFQQKYGVRGRGKAAGTAETTQKDGS
jgi:hypothetical protein